MEVWFCGGSFLLLFGGGDFFRGVRMGVGARVGAPARQARSSVFWLSFKRARAGGWCPSHRCLALDLSKILTWLWAILGTIRLLWTVGAVWTFGVVRRSRRRFVVWRWFDNVDIGGQRPHARVLPCLVLRALEDGAGAPCACSHHTAAQRISNRSVKF